MKKAFLVSFVPTTRVVVDVSDNFLKDDLEPQDEYEWDKVVSVAKDQIVENGIDNYFNRDTIDEIKLDEELPYPQSFDI